MQKIIHICIIIFLIMVVMNGVGCGNDSSSKTFPSSVDHGCEWARTLPESRPADFNLQFKYGYGGIGKNSNELNTFNGTYKKDLGLDPPVTIDFRLTEEDMDRIYQKMVEVDFFCYPEKFEILFPDGSIVSATSDFQAYYYMVECDGKVKTVRWYDNILKENEDAKNLRKVSSLIESIIRSKDTYWELPSFSGFHY